MTGALIIAVNRATQMPCLNADDRVGLRVKCRVTAEDLNRDRIRLDPVRTPRERLLYDIGQKLLVPIRRREVRIAQESFQRFPTAFGRRTRALAGDPDSLADASQSAVLRSGL